MKTNPAARRARNLRLNLACLAIVAFASLDLWAWSYCCSHRAKIAMRQSAPAPAWNGSGTGSELFQWFGGCS